MEVQRKPSCLLLFFTCVVTLGWIVYLLWIYSMVAPDNFWENARLLGIYTQDLPRTTNTKQNLTIDFGNEELTFVFPKCETFGNVSRKWFEVHYAKTSHLSPTHAQIILHESSEGDTLDILLVENPLVKHITTKSYKILRCYFDSSTQRISSDFVSLLLCLKPSEKQALQSVEGMKCSAHDYNDILKEGKMQRETCKKYSFYLKWLNKYEEA